MNWILEEVIDSINSRVKALRKVVNDDEVPTAYKMAKVEEIDSLRSLLKDIFEMLAEENKEVEDAEEDESENRHNSYLGI